METIKTTVKNGKSGNEVDFNVKQFDSVKEIVDTFGDDVVISRMNHVFKTGIEKSIFVKLGTDAGCTEEQAQTLADNYTLHEVGKRAGKDWLSELEEAYEEDNLKETVSKMNALKLLKLKDEIDPEIWTAIENLL